MRYEQATQGIRVRVEPVFSPGDSDPSARNFVFAYHIEMANEGERAAQLLFRHWLIHDSSGEDQEVDGEGVVGEQPRLEPGGSHRYRSFCVLHSPTGYMEGYYTFERPDGERFRVAIPRFHFQAPIIVTPEEDGPRVMN
jgi:ApaG protein